MLTLKKKLNLSIDKSQVRLTKKYIYIKYKITQKLKPQAKQIFFFRPLKQTILSCCCI